MSETSHEGSHALCTKVFPLATNCAHWHTDHLLFMVAKVVIAKHIERAGRPLIEHTCRKHGSPNLSNKFMVLVPGVPRLRQLREIFRRA